MKRQNNQEISCLCHQTDRDREVRRQEEAVRTGEQQRLNFGEGSELINRINNKPTTNEWVGESFLFYAPHQKERHQEQRDESRGREEAARKEDRPPSKNSASVIDE